MKIEIITIFPELFSSFLNCSIIAKAQERNIVEVKLHDLRDYSTDKHRTVDDTPYGGGPGMVMKPEPWFAALEDVWQYSPEDKPDDQELIMLTPRGEKIHQKLFEELTDLNKIVMLCGRYEGFDDRVRSRWKPKEVSLGDFIINGGELAAQVIIEGVTRLLPGAIGDPESALQDSFSRGLLDHRHFTKPHSFQGLEVPEVLTSGNHELIRKWRLEDSLETTLLRRPELLESLELNKEEKRMLEDIRKKHSL